MQRPSLFNCCCQPEDEDTLKRKNIKKTIEKKMNFYKNRLALRYGLISFVSLFMLGLLSFDGYLIHEDIQSKSGNFSHANSNSADDAVTLGIPIITVICMMFYIWFVRDMLSNRGGRNFSKAACNFTDELPFENIEKIKNDMVNLKIQDIDLTDEEKTYLSNLRNSQRFMGNSLISEVMPYLDRESQESQKLLVTYV